MSETPPAALRETTRRAQHMIRYLRIGARGVTSEEPQVIETADVVVVGGGVNGVSTAYALAACGAGKVVLCEQAALANGASGRSSALVRMHYTSEWDARLAFASFPIFRHWPEIMGGPPVFTHTGFVNVVAPQYADALGKNVAMLRGIGVNTVALTPGELRDLQPFANVDDIGAGAVVVAAGAWAPRICHAIGLELPARPKAIDTVQVTRPPALTEPHVIFIDNVLGTYFRPESGIRTIVGVPCQEWDVDPDAPLVLAPDAPTVGAQMLTHRIPAMEGATLARGYRAVDCYSRDRHAILGRVDGIDGLYLATAFSGSGFKIAPAVGSCMAELIVDGRAKRVDIDAFALRRFAEGKSPEGPHPYATRRDHLER